MQILDFIFRLGVLFAIYGFIWSLFEFGLRILSQGRVRSTAEIYLIRGVKYFFLADVTFIFCFENNLLNSIGANKVILAGLILLIYFIGKLQKNQTNSAFFKIAGKNFSNGQKQFHYRFEVAIIALALLAFSLFWFYPSIAINPISVLLQDSIVNIENTPIFGFIFKIIGFFFLLSIILKMLNSINFLINGKKNGNQNMSNDSNSQNIESDNHFDDYEEVDESL